MPPLNRLSSIAGQLRAQKCAELRPVPEGPVLPLQMNPFRGNLDEFVSADEFCHHTPVSLAALSPEDQNNAYDRWFLNGYDRTGTTFFACAFGTYPGAGREVVDGSFCVIIDGVQHNLRASRHLPAAEWNNGSPPETACGPIRIEVLDPLVQVRLTVAASEQTGGVAADLLMTARTEPVREPFFQTRVGGKKMEYSRLTQLVAWEGVITAPGGRAIQVSDFWGVRDRSWGIRPLGEVSEKKKRQMSALASPETRKAVGERMLKNMTLSALKASSFYWLWGPVNLPNAGVLYHNQQLEGGDKLDNSAAAVVPLTGPGGKHVTGARQLKDMPPLKAIGHEVVYKEGTRHAAFCLVVVEGDDEEAESRLHLHPTGVNFYMSGAGYGHPTWGHGVRHAQPLAVTTDSIDLANVDEMDPLYQHIQALCTVDVENKQGAWGTVVQTGGACGLEQLVGGMHQPSGLQHAFDVPKKM